MYQSTNSINKSSKLLTVSTRIFTNSNKLKIKMRAILNKDLKCLTPRRNNFCTKTFLTFVPVPKGRNVLQGAHCSQAAWELGWRQSQGLWSQPGVSTGVTVTQPQPCTCTRLPEPPTATATGIHTQHLHSEGMHPHPTN